MSMARRWTGWAAVVALLVCAPGCRKKHQSTEKASASPPAAAQAGKTLPAAVREALRPPKPTPVASVAPPHLPRLRAQAHHAKAPPPRPVKGEAPCGSVWTGTDEVQLECDVATRDPRFGKPAVALIPYSMLRAPKGDLPTTVDHRLDGFEGRTLAQGKAGACTAFSLASQIDHALGLWTGKPGDVSPMQIWARYHDFRSTSIANIGQVVASDAEWPYDSARAMAWSRCKLGDASCLAESERRRLDELNKKGVVVLEQVEHLPEDDTLLDVMQAKLAAGRDIGTGGKLPRSFHPIGDPGSKYIPQFNEFGQGAHAFSIVGYTHVEGERYFLIKNSWGERWGDKGYAWIHELTLRKIIHGGSVVVVDPVGDVGLRRHRRHSAQVAACAAGEAPDTIDGSCQPLCPDGGPRHRGYCGITADCTRGFVNVTGDCVVAAPAARGTEPKTGIAFACAPSGCVYTIPKGEAGCTAATCQKSCPAPDFRLGSGRGGLICLE